MLDRFIQDIGPGGLLLTPPGRRLFLDWSTMSKQEPNAIYNLHFLLSLQLATEMATEIKADADAAHWEDEAGSPVNPPFAQASGMAPAGGMMHNVLRSPSLSQPSLS